MKRQSNLAVCVLNYLNYEETITCVDSVLKQKGCMYNIIIVDNGSHNKSFAVLNKRYGKKRNISIIHANKNYGFAKGHNIGINYARKYYNAEYILLLNSDTVLTEEDYLLKLLKAYEQGIGVIGSNIITRNGKEQGELKGYITFPATVFYYFSLLSYCQGFIALSEYFDNILKNYEQVKFLHGSAFMLTPCYFKHYLGLYDKTFLYAEEDLLYMRCQRHGLLQKKVNNTHILHKGGQSVKVTYGGGAFEKNKYRLKSYKFVLWESIRDSLILKRIF